MTNRKTVRIGVIGPSWWFDFWHLPAIWNHPDAILSAVCSARPRSETETEAKYGTDVETYQDWEQMLAEAHLDGVIVCTPNDLHAPASLAVLRHGVNVICEKPVALDAGQAEEMARVAKAKNLLGMSNFPYRDNPAVSRFRESVLEGYLGKLLHIRGEYHGGFGLQRPPGWRGSRSRSGSGILGDLGSHLIDLIRFVTDREFEAVCAHTLTLLRDGDTGELTGLARSEDPRVGDRNDDSCEFLAELGGGAPAVLHTSWLAYQGALGQHQEIEAFGTQGRLHFVANHAGTFLRGMRTSEADWSLICDDSEIRAVASSNAEPAMSEDYFRPGRMTSSNTTYRWIEAISRACTEISPDLEDGLRAQQVIDAVIRSSAERRWVEV